MLSTMQHSLAQTVNADAENPCSADGRDYICRQVFDWTGNRLAANLSDWFVQLPLIIMIVLICAWIASKLVQRVILRFAKGIGAMQASSGIQAIAARAPGSVLADEKHRARARARSETLGHVLRSIAMTVIWTMAALISLSEIGVNLGPMIAGAGIAGIALGFGAQSVVKDFLSGLFMLIEDHYGVGDMITVGNIMGQVKEVTLRSTVVRDRDGIVWHIPNGQIDRVGNFSQVTLRARINIDIAYGTDTRKAIKIINEVGNEMWESEECHEQLALPPKVSGVQELGSAGVALRVVVETKPALAWPEKRRMEREFRLRTKEALQAAKIEMPFPQYDVWMRDINTRQDSTSR